jgi:UDP-2-acetamido-2,6-beta-L-arabino-hexul-4-ose reductase
LKIGITGQTGFIGTYLYNFLGLHSEVVRIAFDDEYFNDNRLNDFVKSCDVIVHLAAMNRHNDPEVIYETNINLVKKLIEACESTNSTPHILFSSSTQEENDNLYGKSKRDGRNLLEKWAERNNSKFTGLVIPNVFGPFGNPYYNSFIATFCYQLTHGELPEIEIDGDVKLIYIGELVEEIFGFIVAMHKKVSDDCIIDKVKVKYTSQSKVSTILRILEGFKKNYFEKGIIPDLSTTFEKNLFNTFLCFIDHAKFFPFHLTKHSDDRGSFIEVVKLNSGGQVSFSTTVQGVTRGNHYHTRKAERFTVIKGKARINLRKVGTSHIISFDLDGRKPSFVDMPVWYTHNIKNVGNDELITIFWINEHYNPEDGDTYFEQV